MALFLRNRRGGSDRAFISTIWTTCSPRHVPAKIVQVEDIPRTKNGKIAELAVREVIHGRPVTSAHALANPQALNIYRDIAALND